MIMFVRSGFPFNYVPDDEGNESAIHCNDRSLAQQSQAADADINTIVRRFHLTGELPQGVVTPSYQEFEGVFDYQSALNLVREADAAFLRMPADVRGRFHNDAQEFLVFFGDEKNRAEAEKLGLVLKKEVVPPVVAPVAPGAAVAAPVVPAKPV